MPGQDVTESTPQEAHESQTRPPRQRQLRLREFTAEAGNYDGLGAELKAARLRKGLDLAEVAGEIRIRRVHLRAMEEGFFNDLPAHVYAVGFVRSYSDYLGLDGEVAVKAFKREASGLGGETKLVFPSPIPESRIPTGWLIALSLVLAGLIYAGWYYAEMNGRLATDRVTPVPERLAALAPAPTREQSIVDGSIPAEPVENEETFADGPTITDTVTGVSPANADTTVELRQVGTPDVESSTEVESRTPGSALSTLVEPQEEPSNPVTAAPETQGAGTAVSRVASESLPPAQSSSESTGNPGLATSVDGVQAASRNAILDVNSLGHQSRIYGEGNWDARIIVKANNESWVQIMSKEGELLLTRILRPGDQYLVPNREDLYLMTGNAGGIEITVDGQPVPAIGQSGDVRGNVALVPDRLTAGTAVKP